MESRWGFGVFGGGGGGERRRNGNGNILKAFGNKRNTSFSMEIMTLSEKYQEPNWFSFCFRF